MSYDEVLTRLIEMKSRYDIGFSSIDRLFLDSLYFTLFGKNLTNRGCSDCYRDAYIEINTKLKRDKKMPEKSLFKLKPGAVISHFGESKSFTNANLTDKEAIRFLAKDPSNANLFAELPDDWKSMVDEYLKNCTNDNGSKSNGPTLTDVANEKIIECEKEIERLKGELNKVITEKSIAETEAFNLKEELSGANNSLQIALEENEKLRKEIETLKATKSGKSKKSVDKEDKPEETAEEKIPDLEIE